MRRLIVNADDFGLTPGVNRAILEAHSRGVVTSATLMADASAFTEAVALANSAPRLGVGCHVVLVDGTPVLPAAQVPSLLASRNGNTFRSDLSGLVRTAVAGKLKSDELEAEITAQIRKLQAAGIHVSHLDTHKHSHIFPQILKPLLAAAKACGIAAIRNPFEPAAVFTWKHARLWKRQIMVRGLSSLLSSKFRSAVRDAGLHTPDGTVGIAATGVLDEALFREIVERIPEGTWEFVCHPGYNDASLDAVRTRLRESRVHELQLLTATSTRELLERHGIELISYRDLGPAR